MDVTEERKKQTSKYFKRRCYDFADLKHYLHYFGIREENAQKTKMCFHWSKKKRYLLAQILISRILFIGFPFACAWGVSSFLNNNSNYWILILPVGLLIVETILSIRKWNREEPGSIIFSRLR